MANYEATYSAPPSAPPATPTALHHHLYVPVLSAAGAYDYSNVMTDLPGGVAGDATLVQASDGGLYPTNAATSERKLLTVGTVSDAILECTIIVKSSDAQLFAGLEVVRDGNNYSRFLYGANGGGTDYTYIVNGMRGGNVVAGDNFNLGGNGTILRLRWMTYGNFSRCQAFLQDISGGFVDGASWSILHDTDLGGVIGGPAQVGMWFRDGNYDGTHGIRVKDVRIL